MCALGCMPINILSGLKLYFVLFLFGFLSACTASPPKNIDNICDIFKEKKSWYKEAKKATKRWNINISTNMAIMHQESGFRAKAKPPRKKILGFIPGPRISSAFGYSQAKKSTWKWYKKESGHWGADRDDFDDAIDFIAWYNNVSVKQTGISRYDPYSLYLAYHEGHGGYRRGTYNNKKWLRDVAQRVNQRAKRYQSQLSRCESQLKSSWWWPF